MEEEEKTPDRKLSVVGMKKQRKEENTNLKIMEKDKIPD